jgi:hypothetical protein
MSWSKTILFDFAILKLFVMSFLWLAFQAPSQAQEQPYKVVKAPWGNRLSSKFRDHEHLIKVDEFHTHSGTLILESLKIQKAYGTKITPEFYFPLEVKSDVVTRLFPNHRFFILSWNEQPSPENKEKILGLAGNLYVIIIVAPDGSIELLNDATTAYSEFFTFVIKQKLSIRSQEDARDIWMAFCDIHQHFWHSRDLQQITATQWHLGKYRSVDRFNYQVMYETAYVIDLNPDQTLQSIKLERLQQPKTP